MHWRLSYGAVVATAATASAPFTAVAAAACTATDAMWYIAAEAKAAWYCRISLRLDSSGSIAVAA